MLYMLRLLACIISFVLAAPAQETTNAATYDITHVYSSINFNISKFFFNEEGGFGRYAGKIFYDHNHPERSRVQMTVQAASIDTRNERRDKVLRSDNFFDVASYPTLNCASTSVVPKQNGMLDVIGDLTIHGVTKHITIPVRFLGAKQMQGWGDFIGFDTEFSIDRTEFGVNGGSSWSGILSKEVEIRLSIGAFKEGTK